MAPATTQTRTTALTSSFSGGLITIQETVPSKYHVDHSRPREKAVQPSPEGKLCSSQGQSKNTQTALQPHSTKMARCNRALQMQQCYKQMSNESADKEGTKRSIPGIHPMFFSQKSVLCGIKQSRAFKRERGLEMSE